MGRVEGTEVCSCSQIDFWIGEDAFCGALVEAVHSGVACVGAQAGDEEGAFGVGEEGGGFGPVCYPEFRDETADDGYDAFDYEDPSLIACQCLVSLRLKGNLTSIHRIQRCRPFWQWRKPGAMSHEYDDEVKWEGDTYTSERSSDDAGREEERETPLKLIALVVHGDEIDAT
jgi:hypothetical protein